MSSAIALERFAAEGAEPFYRGEVAAALSEFVIARRWHPGTRGPRRLRGDRAGAGAGALPRRRGADQPATVGGRHADRPLARRAGAARSTERPRATGRRDGRRRGVPREPARLDHPHLGDRRGRDVRRGDLLERLRLRRAGAGDRGDPQQHAGRGGPQPARLPHDPGGGAGAFDDGADRRPARGRGRARPRQRRIRTGSARQSCRRSSARSRRGWARPRRSPLRASTPKAASSRPSRGSTRTRWRRLEARGVTVLRRPEINLFFGGVQAVSRDPATGALSGGGDPRRGGAVAYA